MSTAHKHLTAHAHKLAWHRKQCLKLAQRDYLAGDEAASYMWLFIMVSEENI